MVFITRDRRQIIEQTSYPTAETPARDTLGNKTILLQPVFLTTCLSVGMSALSVKRIEVLAYYAVFADPGAPMLHAAGINGCTLPSLYDLYLRLGTKEQTGGSGN